MKTKTNAMLWLALFSTLFLQTRAQDTTFYSFEASSKPYMSLVGINVDFMDTALNQNHIFNPVGDYPIFGETRSLRYEASASSGFLVSISNDFAYTLDPFLCPLVKRDSGSALIIHGMSLSTDTALIVEWVNMGLEGHPASDFVNFQLWIYNTKDVIEMHYGSSKVTSNQAFRNGADDGPAINLARRHVSFTPAHDDNWLYGDPNNPMRQTSSGYTAIDGVPDSGVVYRFYVTSEDTTETGFNEKTQLENAPVIFPNPAREYTMIHLPIEEKTGKISLMDMNFNLLALDTDFYDGICKINLRDTPSGLYFLSIETPEKNYIEKLIIE